ncbi:nuclear pore complex component-domain-containing protein [Xylogone sp. PMI_703]|nr:nuclear pore complex component-domain-containing protein [Xylogone sp. PMI_703]
MSAHARPSTPVTQVSLPATPQAGNWRHPQFDEITRRQNATNFSDRNILQIIYNTGGLAVLWLVARFLWDNFPTVFLPNGSLQPYATYAYHTLQMLFTFNIGVALLPLFRPKDDLSDIPLTPGQRKLLGLPPSSAPPTPGSSYITPPRYPRTSTPLSGSVGSKGSYSNSPLSRKGSPSTGNFNSSQFSPASSPLFQKTMAAGLNGNRRSSYNSSSPLGFGSSRISMPETPGSPSPSAAKGASVGLNNRWLYEKMRRSTESSYYS